jgi:antitoxin VapB
LADRQYLSKLIELLQLDSMVEKWHHSTMALNIKNKEAEELAAEVASMTGDTKTGAVREALRERKQRLELRAGGKGKPRSMQEWLETEIWPQIPEEELGKEPLTKDEIEDILGFGPGGV